MPDAAAQTSTATALKLQQHKTAITPALAMGSLYPVLVVPRAVVLHPHPRAMISTATVPAWATASKAARCSLQMVRVWHQHAVRHARPRQVPQHLLPPMSGLLNVLLYT